MEGGHHGVEGVEAFIRDTREVFDKFETHFEFTDHGEQVLAVGTIYVRARGSGIETDIEVGGVFEFRDGESCAGKTWLRGQGPRSRRTVGVGGVWVRGTGESGGRVVTE
jgi:hypothetical protein